MYVVGLLLAIFVGITLGMIGSGGSIMTVPILVYVLGINPVLATTYSLLIIGTTSLVGAVSALQHKTIDFNKVIYFGLPSMLTVFLVRSYILPLVPDEFLIWGYAIHQENVLMVIFAIIMLYSAVSMIQGKRIDIFPNIDKGNVFYIVIQGIMVGTVTGVVGAGGGFLIIPVLINSFGLTIKRAVSTSLVLITINSLIGIIGDIDRLNQFDWKLIISYILLSIIGLFIGFRLSNRIDNSVLKRGFGIVVFVLSIFILIQELFVK
ncbi:sulfite exporter TauE/SafE family protein [Sphingobacterium rhinopitheci]|uniref:sulfite exporter TauE/SafE family protein n=1 Tax=Sphingobacterium rhinopitheci TaxID=2781960 RepID=UPI001F52616A|nr:sulfite exporter TauE/SafE family protein [Sphingobacterium rhinopitheci]MCI0922306.1 sulfite exporter TauE/SafE family protein [Sphingobacterium rhinopitheci]